MGNIHARSPKMDGSLDFGLRWKVPHKPPKGFTRVEGVYRSCVNMPGIESHLQLFLMRPAMDWITFASVEERVTRGIFERVDRPSHCGVEDHAARIAALLVLIREGHALDPITLTVECFAKGRHGQAGSWTVRIQDGNHRYRAIQFAGLQSWVPAIVYGAPPRLFKLRSEPDLGRVF